jgi:hypothetical protein
LGIGKCFQNQKKQEIYKYSRRINQELFKAGDFGHLHLQDPAQNSEGQMFDSLFEKPGNKKMPQFMRKNHQKEQQEFPEESREKKNKTEESQRIMNANFHYEKRSTGLPFE